MHLDSVITFRSRLTQFQTSYDGVPIQLTPDYHNSSLLRFVHGHQHTPRQHKYPHSKLIWRGNRVIAVQPSNFLVSIQFPSTADAANRNSVKAAHSADAALGGERFQACAPCCVRLPRSVCRQMPSQVHQGANVQAIGKYWRRMDFLALYTAQFPCRVIHAHSHKSTV